MTTKIIIVLKSRLCCSTVVSYQSRGFLYFAHTMMIAMRCVCVCVLGYYTKRIYSTRNRKESGSDDEVTTVLSLSEGPEPGASLPTGLQAAAGSREDH